MLGAIIGDMVGSPYEFGNRMMKGTDFPLWIPRSQFTDDTVLTLAVAEGLMNGYSDPQLSEIEVRNALLKYGRLYPRAGYGERFIYWMREADPKPYNSFGNGSAMRVSSAGWLYDTLSDVELFAAISARVTHNHPEGIKGARSVAAAIYMARTGSSKEEIRTYIEKEYGYDLSRTCDEIRPDYNFKVSCQESVPEAIICFLEADSYERAIRLAVSLGGDSDTQAAIAGSIAEAYFGIPEELKEEGLRRLPPRLRRAYDEYIAFFIREKTKLPD